MTSSNELCFALGGAGWGGGCREAGGYGCRVSRAPWRLEARRAAVFTACAAFGHTTVAALVSLAESKRVKRRTSAELRQIFRFGTEAEPRGALHYSAAAWLAGVSEALALLRGLINIHRPDVTQRGGPNQTAGLSFNADTDLPRSAATRADSTASRWLRARFLPYFPPPTRRQRRPWCPTSAQSSSG